MYFKKLFCFTTIILGLSACAGVPPQSLQPFTNGQSIEIKNDFIYSKIYGETNLTYTLKSGIYEPKYKGADGVYYQGGGKCFIEKNILGKEGSKNYKNYDPNSFYCGILYSNESRTAKIYFYRDENLSKLSGQSGVLIEAFNNAELKNIHIHPYQPDATALTQAISFK